MTSTDEGRNRPEGEVVAGRETLGSATKRERPRREDRAEHATRSLLSNRSNSGRYGHERAAEGKRRIHLEQHVGTEVKAPRISVEDWCSRLVIPRPKANVAKS